MKETEPDRFSSLKSDYNIKKIKRKLEENKKRIRKYIQNRKPQKQQKQEK